MAQRKEKAGVGSVARQQILILKIPLWKPVQQEKNLLTASSRSGHVRQDDLLLLSLFRPTSVFLPSSPLPSFSPPHSKQH